MSIIVVVAVLGLTAQAVDAAQCACATGTVNVRNGAGTNHAVLGTMPRGTCVTYLGNHVQVGSMQWAHVQYSGQYGYVASNWLSFSTQASCGSPATFQSTSSQQLAGCPRIISRAEWGARNPKQHIGNLPMTPQNVYIHHGASSPCFNEADCKSKMRSYQNYHMDHHGWADIGYTFVIGEDGNVYESRGWDKIGTHTLHHNYDGLGFCVIGNFMDHNPNAAAINAVKQLIACGVANGKIRSDYIIYGHRDVRQTACPGNAFYQLIQSWPHYKSPR